MPERTPRVVLDGLMFPEIPRWRDGQLWFCDFELWAPGATGRVLVVDEGGHARTVVQDLPGGPPTGLGWLPDGRLLVLAAEGRALWTVEPDGTLAPHADLSGSTSHWANDLVVDAAGRAYVGTIDPPPAPPVLSELLVVQPDGRVEVADSAMRFPNGSVLTPDGRTLIVAESHGEQLTAFSVAADGSLGDRRVWAAVPGMYPDGICLDTEGCVWFADAGGNACVRVAEGGRVLDRVGTDQGVFACALGGADGRSLFAMTSSFPESETDDPRPGRIVAYQVDVPGAGAP
jgi:sugar lactone lactonase YvrE